MEILEKSPDTTVEEVMDSPLGNRLVDLFGSIGNYDHLKDLKEKDRIKAIRADMTDEQIMLAVEMEMSMIPIEINVSAGEKRQVSQYNPNDYWGSMRFDIKGMSETVVAAVRAAPKGKKIEVYIEARKILHATIESKFRDYERFIRGILKKQELKDGIRT
jgi:hypothetical protein